MSGSPLVGLGLGKAVEQTVVLNQNVTTTGAGSVSSTPIDVSMYEADILVLVSARASGTGTMSIGVEESNVAGSGFAPVMADALVDVYGENDTFSNVAAEASHQMLVVKKSLLKKYLRVTLSGTNLDQEVAIVITGQKRFTYR